MDNASLSGESLESAREGGARSGARIDKYFRAMGEFNASDLHLKANTPAKFRVKGDIRDINKEPLSNARIEALIFEIMNDKQLRLYRERGSMDFAYQLGDADRFRINVFRQRGNTSVAARRIPREILGYEQLHLPPSLARLADLQQGMIILAGITGSGKSTTIAAMIEQINQSRACHIVTVEDPIEFLYDDKKAFINQREVGLDVANFSDALKYLMREDPDVVLIGEMRDRETFAAALNAAETGHLVFCTIHASSAPGTITRILELFEEEERDLIRTSLVFNLQGIICLKLLPGLRRDIPRIPTCEIMIANTVIRKLIEEKRDNEIPAVIRASYHEGMIDFTESLRQLVEKEFISVKTAYAVAPNPDELKMRLKGINVSSGGIIG
ncbi:MAG: PilT/PilU family type 4a pilus ATPase [Phycisphaerales bacterium]|nr:MAG: PilT/PilU family type 4a pilus ATPase [Phycisphaerales bacterium]